ncbi:hypothetical protein ACFCQI_14225 [Rhodanobacter sp. FW102-FHT14D06]|uniref:Uncharacterized protein n=2 Tax=unclassified Rhodanobacter TaxID=2621553 RepID=A0AB74UZQ3_9GAMM
MDATHLSVQPPTLEELQQALATVSILESQCESLTATNITRMGDLLVKCYRENRAPLLEEIEQVGRELLPRPHLVASAVRDALK